MPSDTSYKKIWQTERFDQPTKDLNAILRQNLKRTVRDVRPLFWAYADTQEPDIREYCVWWITNL